MFTALPEEPARWWRWSRSSSGLSAGSPAARGSPPSVLPAADQRPEAVAQPGPAEEAALAAQRLRAREAPPMEGRGGEGAPVGLDCPARDGGIYNGKTFN